MLKKPNPEPVPHIQIIPAPDCVNSDLLFDQRKHKAVCMPLPKEEPDPEADATMPEIASVAAFAVDVGMFDKDYKRERNRILTNLNDP